MHFNISSHWLYKSWGKLHAFNVLPQCTVKANKLKVLIFVKEGVAMRICETTIFPTFSEDEIDTTFVVTNAMRSFVARLKDFHSSIAVDIDLEEKNITFTLESVASALKYTFEHVQFDDEKYIDPDPEDIAVKVPLQDWKSLCFLAPSVGKMTLECTERKRACIIKHEGGRWAGVIQFQEKISKNISFVCNSDAMRRLCILFNTDASFISILFLKCGVMMWSDNRGLYGYIAPIV